MTQATRHTIALGVLMIGIRAGFMLCPVIVPVQPADIAAVPAPADRVSNEARGTQYFVAHIGEAHQVVAGCRNGSVRGGECATAEEAIVKVDAQERRKRFLSN